MKVLIVARYKEKGFAPFVTEQVAALEGVGVECRMFPVKSNNYLRYYPELRRAIRSFRPDIVHAHYGLCGLLANLQRRVPVVTTYHGSDINDSMVRPLSAITIWLSRYNVFVSKKHIDLMHPRKDYSLLPCGINLKDFPEMDKEEARIKIGLSPNKQYVLFSGAFDNKVKNSPLAKDVVMALPDVELLEFKGYSRHQVAVLMQAVDVLLMTSHCEGSPQVIKEALACGCPIVSVDVGDVKERIKDVKGCYLSKTMHSEEIRDLIKKALAWNGKTTGRQVILKDRLDNSQVAESLSIIYRTIWSSKLS